MNENLNQERFDFMVLFRTLVDINQKLVYGEELKPFEKVLLARLSVTFAETHRLNDIIKSHYSTK